MQKISVYIIAYNEAAKIADTINSVLWADEIVLADSASTDGTDRIAAEMGARIVQIPFEGFGHLRNRAIAACTHEWILSIDTDEQCTPEVRDEILSLLAGSPLIANGPTIAGPDSGYQLVVSGTQDMAYTAGAGVATWGWPATVSRSTAMRCCAATVPREARRKRTERLPAGMSKRTRRPPGRPRGWSRSRRGNSPFRNSRRTWTRLRGSPSGTRRSTCRGAPPCPARPPARGASSRSPHPRRAGRASAPAAAAGRRTD